MVCRAGFLLLAHALTKTLCLADVFPETVATCRRTVACNGLEGKVVVYRSDNLRDIPASEHWDLMVSNPPHFVYTSFGQLRYHDPDWRVHRGFFAAVGKHLKPSGVVVLQENNEGSTPATFAAMIAGAGQRVVFEQDASPTRTKDSHMFYLGIMRPGDAVPARARN